MLPNGLLPRVILAMLVAGLIAVAVMFLRQPSGTNMAAVQSAAARLDRAERDRQAVAVRAEAVASRAATARAATKPLVARAESLRARVHVVASGQLRIDSSVAGVIPVPPLVTDRLQSDSVAMSALTVALTWDASAAAAQQERLAAEATARSAASLTIAQLERERSPRCGRRCGFVLGAASIVALGIAAEQMHRLLHP